MRIAGSQSRVHEDAVVSPPAGSSVVRAPEADFDDFYRLHRDPVARTLALTLGDDALGYEAADEAMSRAYERWNDVSGYDNPQGWVYRVGLNWARSWLRRRKRGTSKDPLIAVAEEVEDQQIDTDLALAISRLPYKHRSVVVLRFYRDWSVAETAEALGIAAGTVKSRLSRALEQLEQQLTTNAASASDAASGDGSATTTSSTDKQGSIR